MEKEGISPKTVLAKLRTVAVILATLDATVEMKVDAATAVTEDAALVSADRIVQLALRQLSRLHLKPIKDEPSSR